MCCFVPPVADLFHIIIFHDMKQTIRLIAFFLNVVSPFFLFSQTFTIGANNGTNTNSTYPTPYGDFRESTRSNFLYRASELTAAGVTAGNITKLGFFVENVDGVDVHENYTIKLLLTTSVELPNGTWQNGGVTVYGPVDYTPVVGLNEYTVAAPFYWNGTANLVVDICHSANPTTGISASNNAVVQWTEDLLFKGSRTRALNNSSDVCTTNATNENGIRNNRPVLSLTLCYPPTNLTASNLTSNSADVSWIAPAGNSPAGYDYTYGLSGYQPGVSGTELGNGTTTMTHATIGGLNGLETYAFWVRSDCGDGFSRWAGPLNFTTDPSCGDLFLDPSGVQQYEKNVNSLKVLCPDVADNALTVSFFVPFSLGAGDTLKVYNGNSTSAPLMAALSGVYSAPPLPGPFSCTTASGCLTLQFTSNDTTSPQDLGWISVLSCDPLPPDVCYKVLELDTANVGANTADVSWIDMFGAADYEWQLVELPYTGLSSIVESNLAFDGTSLSFTGLEPGTAYQFAVRTNCINDASSAWDTIRFNTPLSCDGPFIQCGQTYSFTASKTGLWNVTECGSATPGKERIFRFIAPHTRTYNLEITAATGGFVNYLIKAEGGACNSSDWDCIDDFNVPGTTSLPAIPGAVLTAGTLYYILADPQATGVVAQSFKITDCSVPNDLPQNAIDIQVNDPCTENIFSNLDATFDVDEPDPDEDDSDGLVGRWLDDADETVWFRFQAPPSGTVTLFTNPSGSQSPNDDTQVALYQVTDPMDYSTFELLVSDEDNGTAYLGFNSVVSYSGLVDGDYYYIQVDGWGVNSGAFCLSVIETVERIEEANCDAEYKVGGVNEEKWYNIYATPDNLDIGPLVAAINPHGLNLDSVFCRAQKYDEIPYTTANPHIPYLPLYYHFKSKQPFTGNVTLRLFFTDSEFAALKDSANTPSATVDDLVTTRFNGNTADCSLTNNTGAFHFINTVNPVPMVGTFYLEFNTDSLGEFGARLNPLVLPIQLKSFSGTPKDRYNLLEWTTLAEKDVQWHIVERSANGTGWTEIGRKSGHVNSNTPLKYTLEDLQPLAKAYYRLRSVDFDGTASVSQVILLSRRSEQFGITNVFPSPATDQLTVQFAAIKEEDVVIRLTDFVGKIVLEQSATAQKGANSIQLSMGNLPVGVYNVAVANSESLSEPLRVVKQ